MKDDNQDINFTSSSYNGSPGTPITLADYWMWKFVNGDEVLKKMLLIDNVIKSIRALSNKVKKDFNANEMENDILELFNLTNIDIENL